MKLIERARQRIINDEPQTPFDAEPSDLTLLEADEYDPADDVGDEDSQ